MSDGGHQLSDAVGSNISFGAYSDVGVFGGAILAGLFASIMARGVRVGRLKLSVVGLIVDHGTIHGATIASIGTVLATIGAVDKLLLREGLKFASGYEVGAFHSSSSGE